VSKKKPKSPTKVAGLLGVGALLAGSVSVWKRRQQKSNA